MSQIFVDLLNLMWENSLSIAIVLENGSLGACLQKNVFEVMSPRTSKNAYLQYSMYLLHD